MGESRSGEDCSGGAQESDLVQSGKTGKIVDMLRIILAYCQSVVNGLCKAVSAKLNSKMDPQEAEVYQLDPYHFAQVLCPVGSTLLCICWEGVLVS